MLKVTLTILAMALAGTASAAGWRSIQIDASSEADFTQSVNALRERLPTVRRHVLDLALSDIWARGVKDAAAEQREYTESEYLRELDGLTYKEVVTFTDPTGDTADARFRQIYAQLYGPRRPRTTNSGAWQEGFRSPGSLDGQNQRGGVAQMEQSAAWYSR